MEEIIEAYNSLRERCCKLAKADRGELMGKDAWLRHALSERDITLAWTTDGIQCWGSTYTSQTLESEWFDFIIPHERLLEGATEEQVMDYWGGAPFGSAGS